MGFLDLKKKGKETESEVIGEREGGIFHFRFAFPIVRDELISRFAEGIIHFMILVFKFQALSAFIFRFIFEFNSF